MVVILVFGKGIFLNVGCLMLDGAEIKFGNRIAVGPKSMFITTGHPIEPAESVIPDENGSPKTICSISKPITILDDVWIGAGAIILGGVTIGSVSTVGAGSVVTKLMEEKVVIAGNPAKIIRTLSSI